MCCRQKPLLFPARELCRCVRCFSSVRQILSTILACCGFCAGAGIATPQRGSVRRRRPALPHGGRPYRAHHGGDRPRWGEPAQQPCAVPDLHHRKRLRHGDRPHARRYRGFLQYDRRRLRSSGRRQEPDAVFGERRRSRRRRRAFFRQLPRRGDNSEARPRQGLQHGVGRQDRAGFDLRPDGTHRQSNNSRRRRDRQRQGHSAVGGSDRTAQGRRTCRWRRRRAAPTARPAT